VVALGCLLPVETLDEKDIAFADGDKPALGDGQAT
jgi:hypothetical protein